MQKQRLKQKDRKKSYSRSQSPLLQNKEKKYQRSRQKKLERSNQNQKEIKQSQSVSNNSKNVLEGWTLQDKYKAIQNISTTFNQQRQFNKQKQKQKLQLKNQSNDYLKNKVQTQIRINSFKRSSIPSRGRINNSMLSSLIIDQKKMNKKLDQQQVQRASQKFKDKFNQQIKSVTLSQYLSNFQLQKKSYYYQKQIIDGKQHMVYKPFVCTQGSCSRKFKDQITLKNHIKNQHV